MSAIKTVHDAEYATANLGERIVAALKDAGIPPEKWTPEILGPADQIHGGGLQQTQVHAALVSITSDMHLLDIGCGIGGPARYFATEFGCRVTGIDLTDEYIDAASLLTQKIGLSDRVAFDCGDATALPYDDASFDMAWALNVTMNIEDRAGFYAGVHRVLKPGGRFCISEIGQGPGGEPYYPLTWAADPAYSFLLPPEDMRTLLESSGFRVVEWIDETARRKASTDGRPAETAPVETPLTIEITRGADYPDRRKNSGRSAKEGRLTNVMLVAERI
ncbi:MAG: class I SAM-dependent methyltransferase [Rhodospirillaceae bacterium]|jgi:ubiquinone/menaquinone biosynthesis C-methylase UbiE|nr:class I SAM-dependent methyltransferase [Rhodospirillaceae bacterium]